MRCSHCDAPLPDDAIFCAVCGSRVTVPAHIKVEQTIIAARPDIDVPATEANLQGAPDSQGPQRPQGSQDPQASQGEQTSASAPFEKTRVSPGPVREPPAPREFQPVERPRKGHALVIVGLVLLIVALAVGAAYLSWEEELWGGHTLPSVVGLSRADAESTLDAAGFSYQVEEVVQDASIGFVTYQSPIGDTRQDPQVTVRLRVAVARVIPQVMGMDQESARRALLDAGARDVTVTYLTASDPEGTVIGCEPAPGTDFVSTDKVVLTVAQPYTVPNVTGQSVDDALAAVEAAGLQGSVTYVDSDRPQGTVVGTVPAAGSSVDLGTTVELQVPNPDPIDQCHLIEYYDMTPQQVASYLGRIGFSLDMGWSSDAGAFAHYSNTSTGEVIYFTHDPESGHFIIGDDSRDVLAQGVSFVGVRYEWSSDIHNPISTDGVRQVMERCGFSNMVDFCTEETIVAPADVPTYQANFICAYGEQNRYVWAVLIGGHGLSNQTVALVLPKAQFEQADLSNFGGGICDYIAYANYFTG